MRCLTIEELKVYINRGKEIEHYVKTSKTDNYKTNEWISIEKEGKLFKVFQHLVFDESEEGVDSIYDYSYVNPDDLYGNEIFSSENFDNVVLFLENELKIKNGNYLLAGSLDEVKNG